jgi:hypothetical protein
MPKFYKGYRIGSIEKALLKYFLKVSKLELSKKGKYEDETFLDILKTARQKYALPEILKNLEKKKFLILKKNFDGTLRASLTQKGKKFTEQLVLEFKIKNTVPKQWDKKWRMVIFDIPEEKRKSRNLLRFHLKKIGFIQVQASVWAYPYPCKEIVTLVKTYFELGTEVLYLVVTSLEGDKKIKKLFKL